MIWSAAPKYTKALQESGAVSKAVTQFEVAVLGKRISSFFQGDGLKARVLRGSALTFLSFGGARAVRLASNLVLTRLLFPEVFGLMALVQVFMTG